MPFLRQSTAQTFRFGPFLDATDGVTEEVGLTITPALRRLSKDGGAFGAASGAVNATHDSDGWYSASLTTTDTDTVGELILNVQVPATHLPVWMRWWVLEEEVYDDVYGAAAVGYLKPTTGGNDLDVNATGEAGLDLDNTSGTIAAAQIAADAITAAKLAADVGLEIADAVWDEVLTAATHNVATSAGRRLRQIEASFVITAGDAQAGTANTITLASGESATNEIFAGDRVIIVAGTGVGEHGIVTAYNGTTKVCTMSQNWVITPDVNSDYGLVPADVDVETWQHAIATKSATTDLPEVDAKSISDDATAADNLESDHDGTGLDKSNSTIGTCTTNTDLVTAAANADAVWNEARSGHATLGTYGDSFIGLVTGSAEAGTLSTTQMTTDLTEATDEHYAGRTIVWTSGVLAGQASDITAYLGATGRLTYTAITEAPSAGDDFVIY